MRTKAWNGSILKDTSFQIIKNLETNFIFIKFWHSFYKRFTMDSLCAVLLGFDNDFQNNPQDELYQVASKSFNVDWSFFSKIASTQFYDFSFITFLVRKISY